MEKGYTKMVGYKLTFHELRCLMLFLRDYEWEKILKKDNLVLDKYIYDTCSCLYQTLEKRCLQLLASKQINRSVKQSFSELELLSISILAKFPHERNEINSVINKILLELPIEVINVLKSNCHE